MKLHKLVQVKGVFAPLIRTKLPPKLSYKLLKFIRAIEFEENFLNEKLRDIVEQYGKKDDNGNVVFDESGNIVIVAGKEIECNKEVEELNNLEVTPPDMKFTLDELDDLTLSVVDIAIIEDFIKEEETNG